MKTKQSPAFAPENSGPGLNTRAAADDDPVGIEDWPGYRKRPLFALSSGSCRVK